MSCLELLKISDQLVWLETMQLFCVDGTKGKGQCSFICELNLLPKHSRVCLLNDKITVVWIIEE